MSTLRSALDRVLLVAAAGPDEARAAADQAHSWLESDLTVVVAGRRGVGKTSFINGLIGSCPGDVGYTAAERPILVVQSPRPGQPDVPGALQLVSAGLDGRRLVELPEHAFSASSPALTGVGRLHPDLLLFLTHHALLCDELDLIRRAVDHWALGAVDAGVILNDWGADGVRGAVDGEALRCQLVEQRYRFKKYGMVTNTATDDLRDLLARLEPLAEARRVSDVIQSMEHVAARSEDSAWAAGLLDELERATLKPEAHVLRERWAMEFCLSRPSTVPDELASDLMSLTVDSRSEVSDEIDLSRCAAMWRFEANRLPPGAAAVAAVVVRSCQLRLSEAAPRNEGGSSHASG